MVPMLDRLRAGTRRNSKVRSDGRKRSAEQASAHAIHEVVISSGTKACYLT